MAEPSTYLSLRVPKRVAAKLKLEAMRRRSSVNRIVGELLDEHLKAIDQKAALRPLPSEVLSEFIGCLSGAPDDGLDSSMVSEVFARGMQEKHGSGHL